MCNLPNASSICQNNMCVIQSCNTGFGNCDANAQNGCEVNLETDPKNCGTCGNACGANLYCAAGQCGTAPKCPNIMFVFDDTGSTSTLIGGNVTRLQAGIMALTQALNQYPNAAPYGLEIFSSNGAISDITCYMSTSINVPPAFGTAQNIISMITPLAPAGGSNVGESIRRAYENLNDATRDNVIVIITDGGPNCNSGDVAPNYPYTAGEVVNAANHSPQVKTVVVGYDDTQAGVQNGPPSLYNMMAQSGLLPQPGCTGAAGSPCYYPATDLTTTVTSVRTALDRLLLATNGVPGCIP
jgi:hypothetical protein